MLGCNSLTLRDGGSTSHLGLLGRSLRVATIADLGVVRDVGWIVLRQQVVSRLALLRRVRAVGGRVLHVAVVVAHGAVFCSGGTGDGSVEM